MHAAKTGHQLTHVVDFVLLHAGRSDDAARARNQLGAMCAARGRVRQGHAGHRRALHKRLADRVPHRALVIACSVRPQREIQLDYTRRIRTDRWQDMANTYVEEKRNNISVCKESGPGMIQVDCRTPSGRVHTQSSCTVRFCFAIESTKEAPTAQWTVPS